MVYDDDQGLCDTLYHNLFFLMRQRPDLGIVESELKTLVRTADDLPSHTDGCAYDDEMTAPVFDDLRRARSMFNRILIAEGGSFGDSPADVLFAPFADEINVRKAEGERQANDYAMRLGLIPRSKSAKPKSKAGRPTIDLTYEDAQLAYWYLFDEFETAGESRKPNQHEVCDYLAASGKSVSVTTLQSRIKKWKRSDHGWPPPRPRTDD